MTHCSSSWNSHFYSGTTVNKVSVEPLSNEIVCPVGVPRVTSQSSSHRGDVTTRVSDCLPFSLLRETFRVPLKPPNPNIRVSRLFIFSKGKRVFSDDIRPDLFTLRDISDWTSGRKGYCGGSWKKVSRARGKGPVGKHNCVKGYFKEEIVRLYRTLLIKKRYSYFHISYALNTR